MMGSKRIEFHRNPATAVILILTLCTAHAAFAQPTFENPESAVQAFVDALKTNDEEVLASMLGDDWRVFMPSQEIDQPDVDAFLTAWNAIHRFKSIAYGKVQVLVGPEEWTMPVPIVRMDGRWRFDTQAGTAMRVPTLSSVWGGVLVFMTIAASASCETAPGTCLPTSPPFSVGNVSKKRFLPANHKSSFRQRWKTRTLSVSKKSMKAKGDNYEHQRSHAYSLEISGQGGQWPAGSGPRARSAG